MRGLLGLKGQSMDGRRHQRARIERYFAKEAAGSGTITSPPNCATVCDAWLFGAGGGSSTSGADPEAGGGGAALYKRFYCAPGQTLSYSVGAPGVNPGGGAAGTDGGDTTLTLPNGQILRAGGGKGTAGTGTTGGQGGVATGGDVNRTGGTGAPSLGNGTAGEGGAAGGTGDGATAGGGGGCAGFASRGDDLAGGVGGGTGGAAADPGGGAKSGGANGGTGRIVAMFTRVT